MDILRNCLNGSDIYSVFSEGSEQNSLCHSRSDCGGSYCTLSDVEQDYLNAIKILGEKADKD